MACLPKLQRRQGWFCHLIGLYLSYLSIRSQKQRSDGQVPVFIIYAKQIPSFRRRLKLPELYFMFWTFKIITQNIGVIHQKIFTFKW
jgi:hypothetical protein